MTDLALISTEDLIEELKIRRSVNYEKESAYSDPVLSPEYGLIHIYDLRDDYDTDYEPDSSDGSYVVDYIRTRHL